MTVEVDLRFLVCCCCCCVGLKVDKHIRRLDADLARFENELKGKLEVSGYESPEARGLKSKNLLKL